MKVTKQNYEEYALDYIEGTLSVEECAAFEHFLDEHPALADQVRGLVGEMPVLEPDLSVRYGDKAGLKRKTIVLPWMIRGGVAAAVLLGGMWMVSRYRPEELAVSQPPESPVLAAVQQAAPLPVQPARDEAPEPVANGVPLSVPAVEKRTVLAESALKAEEPARIQLEPLGSDWALSSLDSPEIVAPTEVLRDYAGAPEERVVAVMEEFVVETSENSFMTRSTRDYFQDGANQAGFLNVFSRKGLRRIAAGILTPLSSLSPVKVYENEEERVVEIASIPVSRRSNQTEE